MFTGQNGKNTEYLEANSFKSGKLRAAAYRPRRQLHPQRARFTCDYYVLKVVQVARRLAISSLLYTVSQLPIPPT